MEYNNSLSFIGHSVSACQIVSAGRREGGGVEERRQGTHFFFLNRILPKLKKCWRKLSHS